MTMPLSAEAGTRKEDTMRRAVKIEAVLTSIDPITDAELETLAQRAIDETYLDIEKCEISLINLDPAPTA